MKLVAMEETHLPMVLEWRNHPEVRKYMYTQHEISTAEHLSWFERTRHDPAKKLFVCYEEETPFGVIAFTEIDVVNKRTCWAFYSGALDRPGIGTKMEMAAIEYAFRELGIDKLWCEVLSTNPRVIKLHRKFGFLVEGIYRNHYILGGIPVDVVRLSLFRDSWNRYLREQMETALQRNVSPGVISAGKAHEERIVLSREMITQFAQLSGDANPIHSDPTAAREVGFPLPIAHGMLLGAVLSGVFGTRFPGPGTIYVKQDLRFVAPALEGDEVSVRLNVWSRIGRLLIVGVEIRRVGDDVLLAEGEAQLLVPRTQPTC